MEEVSRATAICRCGLFLLTKDDPIVASDKSLPRANVLLEAGYFMSAHGSNRMVMAREEGTEMQADFGGIIYLSFKDRENWRPTAVEIAKSLKSQIESSG